MCIRDRYRVWIQCVPSAPLTKVLWLNCSSGHNREVSLFWWDLESLHALCNNKTKSHCQISQCASNYKPSRTGSINDKTTALLQTQNNFEVAPGIPGNLYGMLLMGTMWAGGGGGRYGTCLAGIFLSSTKRTKCMLNTVLTGLGDTVINC